MEWQNEEWLPEETHDDDNDDDDDDDDDDMQAIETLDSHHHHHHHHHHHPGSSSLRNLVALDRRSTAGSSTSNGPALSSTNSHPSSCGSFRDLSAPLSSPPPTGRPLSSHYFHSASSIISSPDYSSVPGGWSPLSYRQPRSTLSPQSKPSVPADASRASAITTPNSTRHELARRLTFLAQRLACGDDIDEMALNGQLEQMEKAVSPLSSPNHRRQQLPRCHSSPPDQQLASPSPPPRLSPASLPPSRSEAGSAAGSRASLIRSQFSDLSLASFREREREREQELIEEDERQARQRLGIPEAQAKQLIAESNKLNEELLQVAENLKARQEEMDHINKLLVERAERAAERIVFLQNRVAHLEHELDENDDELQHLRICLKAVEIQMPPNPDVELQRCINVFKDDFRMLKRRRAHRTIGSGSSSAGAGGAGSSSSSSSLAKKKKMMMKKTSVLAAAEVKASSTPELVSA